MSKQIAESFDFSFRIDVVNGCARELGDVSLREIQLCGLRASNRNVHATLTKSVREICGTFSLDVERDDAALAGSQVANVDAIDLA